MIVVHHENALGLATCGSMADEPVLRDSGAVTCEDCLLVLGRRVDLDVGEGRTRVVHLWKFRQGTYCGLYPADGTWARYMGAGSFCRQCVRLRAEEMKAELDKKIEPAPARADKTPQVPMGKKDWWL
jgi:hypothetical protein